METKCKSCKAILGSSLKQEEVLCGDCDHKRLVAVYKINIDEAARIGKEAEDLYTSTHIDLYEEM